MDRNGIISFNSSDRPNDQDAFRREMQAFANSAGIPWAFDQDVSQEEAAERWKRLYDAMLRRQIDRALKTRAN